MSEELILKVNDKELTGWTEVKVTRGIERCPSDFDISFTERSPDNLQSFIVKPGDSCQVYLGKDLVITGYIDRYTPSIDRSSHNVRVMGRNKCQDLVDCAAIKQGGQFKDSNVFNIATELAKEYGIKVVNKSKAKLPITPMFNLNLGETSYEIIERLARYSTLLVYDGADGSLLLSPIGSEKMEGAIEEGRNVERASMTHSIDQRFSEYSVFMLGCDTFQDIGDGGNLIAKAIDENVARKRVKYIIADAGVPGGDRAQKRALWECARRFGRSLSVSVTVDSWRDDKGNLWEPNKLVHIKLPTLMKTITQKAKADKEGHELKHWVISEVSYLRDASGTHAELTIMPSNAFEPEPITLLPPEPDLPFLGENNA